MTRVAEVSEAESISAGSKLHARKVLISVMIVCLPKFGMVLQIATLITALTPPALDLHRSLFNILPPFL